MRIVIDPGKERRTINFIDNICFSHVTDLEGNPLDLYLSLMVQNGNSEMRLASGRDDEVSTGLQPLIVWINGAGWRKCDKNLMAAEMQFFAEHGYAVACIQYRHSGIGHFPDQLVDVKTAVRFLRTHAEQYGIDPDRVATMGRSAGGHLSSWMAMNTDGFDSDEWAGASSKVQAAVNYFGPVDVYNVPVNNLLNEKFDYTVLYCKECSDDGRADWKFKTIYEPLPPKGLKWLRFFWKVAKICRQYDVVLGLTDYYPISYLPRKFKFIFWSIGVPASYAIHFGDGSEDVYRKRTAIEKHADANIFYTEEAKKLRLEHGYDGPKIFVAHNTTKVLKRIFSIENRDSVLFIGSLHAAKGIQVLLDAYKLAYAENKDLVKLNIVGGGEPLPEIRKWVADNGLGEIVNVLGPIYEEDKKADLFMRSLACISPLQAGLSVLESMGYGVPFITDAHAITGGEAYNIQDGETGYRVQGLDAEKLKDCILDITANPGKYKAMGKKAFDYYWSCRKPEDMAQGVIDAIEYVLNK